MADIIQEGDLQNRLNAQAREDFDPNGGKTRRRGGHRKLSFRKSDIERLLTEQEKNKFHNFLRKMKSLQVLHPGESRGEYVFALLMVRLYVWLQTIRD